MRRLAAAKVHWYCLDFSASYPLKALQKAVPWKEPGVRGASMYPYVAAEIMPTLIINEASRVS
jgi:hypothetical protein